MLLKKELTRISKNIGRVVHMPPVTPFSYTYAKYEDAHFVGIAVIHLSDFVFCDGVS